MRIVPLVALILLIAAEAEGQPSPGKGTPASQRPVFSAPAWAFPTQMPPPADPFPTADSLRLHRIPGVDRGFTQKEAFNRFAPADWLPQTHPPAAPSVAQGRRPTAIACAFCHLYNGAGRPENATLAGLPVEYIVRQVRAFRDSTRLTANPVSRTNSMHVWDDASRMPAPPACRRRASPVTGQPCWALAAFHRSLGVRRNTCCAS